MTKEKIFIVLTCVFIVLTFIGAGYVLINKGQVSAGYAVVPSIIGILFLSLSITEKKKH